MPTIDATQRFKVGDLVTWTDSHDSLSGLVFTIEKVEHDRVYVVGTYKNGTPAKGWCYLLSCLELYHSFNRKNDELDDLFNDFDRMEESN